LAQNDSRKTLALCKVIVASGEQQSSANHNPKGSWRHHEHGGQICIAAYLGEKNWSPVKVEAERLSGTFIAREKRKKP